MTNTGQSASPSSVASLQTNTAASTNPNLPITPASPQLVRGEEIWPEYWGITRDQISDLLTRLRSQEGWDPGCNVYELVNNYIIPWTQGGGVGYALHMNADAPKEVTLMVSHAWAENAEAFLETLVRSAGRDEVLFVCALSLYQPEDGTGPTIQEQLGSEPAESPFRRVLEHIRQRREKRCAWHWLPRLLRSLPEALLLASVISFYIPTLVFGCVPTFDQCALQERLVDTSWKGVWATIDTVSGWEWRQLPPQFELCLPMALLLLGCASVASLLRRFVPSCRGRMLVVPNREVDIYSRLWCVYEVFVALKLGVPVRLAPSLAFLGKVSSREATCGSDHDAARIRREVELGAYSYDYIDKVVYLVAQRARVECARVVLLYGTEVAVTSMAFYSMNAERTKIWEHVLFRLLGFAIAFSCVCWVFQCTQGHPRFCLVLLCSVSLLGLGSCSLVLSGTVGAEVTFLESTGWALLLSGADVTLFLLVGVCFCTEQMKANCRLAVLVTFSLFALLLLQAGNNGFGWDEFYPDLVQDASLVLSYFCVPALIWWSAALNWGVTVDMRRGWTVAGAVQGTRKRTTKSESELRGPQGAV